MSSAAIAAVPHDPVIAETFARKGFVVIAPMLPRTQVAMARDHLLARDRAGLLAQDTTLGGKPIPSAYGDALLENIMEMLRPRVEYCTGLALFPTYSYARVYRKGDELKPHRDRRACEISISVNLSQRPDDIAWPLCIEGRDKEKASAFLNPGDALVYRGIELTHWRTPYEGEEMVQTFMHYVEQTGPNAAERFDGRHALGTPLVRR